MSNERSREITGDHEQSGVTRKGDHRPFRRRELGTDGQRQGTAHGAEAGGLQQPARFVARPHLRQQDAVRAGIDGRNGLARQNLAAMVDDRRRPPVVVIRKCRRKSLSGGFDFSAAPGLSCRHTIL